MSLSRGVRTTILWTHLLTGVIVGLVVLIMSVTGVILAYERQMIEWADGFSIAPPTADAPRVPVETILANVRAQMPEADLSNVSLNADPNKPTTVRSGRKSIFVDPYTGVVLGEGNKDMRAFITSMRGWHRWIAMSDANRNTGKAITGASNLAFLFLVVSGFYLWWPRRWTWKTVKPVVVPSSTLKGKPRDFNWHNSFGFWAAIPLFFIVLSGVFISYRWPKQLTDRYLGSEMEQQRAREGGSDRGGEGGGARGAAGGGERGGARGATGGGERGEARGAAGSGERGGARGARGGSERGDARVATGSGEQRGGNRGGARGMERGERGARTAGAGGAEVASARSADRGPGGPPGPGGDDHVPLELPAGQLDHFVADAQRRAVGWKTLSVSLPHEGDKKLSVTINRSENPRPDTREQLKFNIGDGQFAGLTTHQEGSLSKRLTAWTRYLHTGEVFGVIGQTIAMLASLIGALLVWTGLMLTWRRYGAWRKRRGRPERLMSAEAFVASEGRSTKPAARKRQPAGV